MMHWTMATHTIMGLNMTTIMTTITTTGTSMATIMTTSMSSTIVMGTTAMSLWRRSAV